MLLTVRQSMPKESPFNAKVANKLVIAH